MTLNFLRLFDINTVCMCDFTYFGLSRQSVFSSKLFNLRCVVCLATQGVVCCVVHHRICGLAEVVHRNSGLTSGRISARCAHLFLGVVKWPLEVRGYGTRLHVTPVNNQHRLPVTDHISSDGPVFRNNNQLRFIVF